MSGVSAATVDDLAALLLLERSFPEGQRWSEASWRAELEAGNRFVVVWRTAGAVAAAATWGLSDGVVDLHRIVTDPDARRTGLARQLLEAGLAWAKGAGASRILLEVGATNTAALALYSSQGFSAIAERPNYYGAGAHAIVLERPLREGDRR